MFTKKMYEEMMVKRHGDWADFFMDASLEFEEAHEGNVISATPTNRQIKPIAFCVTAMEAA